MQVWTPNKDRVPSDSGEPVYSSQLAGMYCGIQNLKISSCMVGLSFLGLWVLCPNQHPIIICLNQETNKRFVL